ncbi:MAG: 16S rRNA (cytidine(1402)-2'-O)-methyltransferase [Spirochaetes bacterium]|nr:16S rRNA (cytidine(1402)-2'-O)-methyltransferase [Spirochaetota bacterium]
MGELFMVGTPIGNLGDITLRALEVLKNADVIACEDTRHSLKLLNHFGISKPLVSCHANDEARAALRIVALLDGGKKVAYCTDAGTPGLSDPGAVLAAAARANGHRVVPIPGPSALAALLSVSGFGGRALLFDGFPSPKAGRRRARLSTLLERGESFVLYESPFRIGKLLGELAALDPGRRICLGRELTKIHEQVLVGTAAELAALVGVQGIVTIPEKGEFALLVDGRTSELAQESEAGEP